MHWVWAPKTEHQIEETFTKLLSTFYYLMTIPYVGESRLYTSTLLFMFMFMLILCLCHIYTLFCTYNTLVFDVLLLIEGHNRLDYSRFSTPDSVRSYLGAGNNWLVLVPPNLHETFNRKSKQGKATKQLSKIAQGTQYDYINVVIHQSGL